MASLPTCGINYSLHVTEVPGKAATSPVFLQAESQHLVSAPLDSPGAPSTPSPGQ